MADTQEYDWVWIDKGTWIYPETVEFLKRNNSVIIHYTPDPALVLHKTRHFANSIRKYDILITTKKYEIEKYKEYGAKNVIFVHQGYGPNTFKPYEVERELRKKLESDVCFVGHTEPHYYYRLKAVSHVVNNLAIWGDQCGRKAFFHPWLKKAWRGGGIWDVEYAKAICCAKIGLGLLSKLAPEQSTTRTYEITACGTFMLAERTDEHCELFDEGKEAEFFSSDEELVDKIKYYLSHDNERKQIAAAGRERCLKSGYSNTERLKEAINKILALKI
jgi:spore maturation protein CgeB